MNLLDEPAFKERFRASMERVGGDEEPPFDFWPYFEEIPEADFEDFDCAEGQVDLVWRTDDGSFEHELLKTQDDADVVMVLVLDRRSNFVHGHRILNPKYGL